jgi:hypothetical protein
MDDKILILFSKARLFKAKSLKFTYKFALELKGAHIIFLCASIILIFYRQLSLSFTCLTLSYVLYILPQITKKALQKMGEQAKENLKSLKDSNVANHSDYLLLKKIKQNLNLTLLVITAILMFFSLIKNN